MAAPGVEVVMIRIELKPSEAEILRAALSSYLSDLSMEIAHTDSRDYRVGLKESKEVLADIVQRLEVARPVGTR